MTHTRLTYLVGHEREYIRYLTQARVPVDSGYAVNVRTLADIQDAVPGLSTVLFLRGWRDLAEWRQIYNHVIARRASLQADAREQMRRIHTRWLEDMRALDAASKLVDRRRGPR